MSTTLSLSSLELTSTLYEAPYGGAPSSQDYNDAWEEVLVDLSTITGFINDTLLPILNALPAAAANGLTGATITTDPSDQSSLFFNAQANTSLVIGDSLRVLLAQVNNLGTQLADLGVEITTLQTQLGNTNQNGLVQTIQSLSQTLNAISQSLSQQIVNITANTTRLSKIQAMRVSGVTVTAGNTVSTNITWNAAYPNNSYTPVVTILGGTNSLSVTTAYSSTAGVGLVVAITNGGGSSVTVTICALAIGD
jgi:hypothetical protein